jgi:class 3 adenylate cyclase
LIFYNQEDDYSVHEYQKDKEIDNTDSLNLTKYSKENEITFTKYSHSYCICIISIVDFTQNIDKLQNPVDIRKYYSIFYNTMALIIKNHDGKVIKNVGDLLLFYFPKTVNFSKPSSFQDVLDCDLAMIQANSTLNLDLNKNDLPSIGYKISANYGLVELATSTNSNGVDLFGPTVNICSKINHLALPNQMVIYKDLYDIIEKTPYFKDYVFKKIDDNDSKNKKNTNIFHIQFIQSKELIT